MMRTIVVVSFFRLLGLVFVRRKISTISGVLAILVPSAIGIPLPYLGREYRLLMPFRTDYGGKRPAAKDSANKTAGAGPCLGGGRRIRPIRVVDPCRRFPSQSPTGGNINPVCSD